MDTINLTAVVRQTGINANTLRAWERRYQVVVPQRDKSGRRVYTKKDVERLQLLKALVREGHLIGLIAEQPTVKLKKLLSSTLSPEAPLLTASNVKTETLLSDITQALEEFDLEKLNTHLQRARFELNTKEIVINLVRPLLGRVGMMVLENRITISQEHLLSSLLRDYLGNIHQSLSPYDLSSRRNSPVVVLTTREGDFHEFGILLAAILCNLYRYRIYYLGPSTPVADLIECSQQVKASFLLLGFTALPTDRERISPQDFLLQLNESLPRQVTILTGGNAPTEVFEQIKDRRILSMGSLHGLDQFLAEHS